MSLRVKEVFIVFQAHRYQMKTAADTAVIISFITAATVAVIAAKFMIIAAAASCNII